MDVLLHPVEHLNFGQRKAHLIQDVIILGNLVAVGHVDEEFDCDLRVIYDQIGQFGWAHVYMENHLFVGFERLAQLIGFVWLEGGLARAIKVLLHLGIVELLSCHIEVPVGLWEHARD